MDPKLLPLVEPIGARYSSLTVDSKLVNAFAEQGAQQGEVFVYKRPGFKLAYGTAAGTARGLFNWRNNIYAVVGNKVYKDGVALAGTVAASGNYTFSSCLGASPVLFMQNGTNAYTISTGGAITAVADPDYPASTVPGTVYLDATTYVMDSTSHIYGSNAAANDPSAWDPLNLILAQIEPTAAICLAKQLVYVVALKQWYSEVFYDAGNATGSPLATVQGAKLNYGCVDAGTVRDVGGDLAWVSDSGEGFYSAVIMSSLKAEVISVPPIERILSSATVGAFHAWNARIEGHRLYGVTNTTANFTLVYDLTSKMWYQWTDVNGNYLPYFHSCQGAGSATYFLHATSGDIYSLDTATYKDGSQGAFPVEIWTPNFDGGTRRYKTLARMDLVGDQVNTDVSVSWSDDDYATFSSALSINMLLDRPTLEGFGSFTKRAFKFVQQANTAFRLKGAEMYLDVGAS